MGPDPAGQDLKPGEALNAQPLEAQVILDFTSPIGKVSGVYYGLMFQLPKWGFARFKIDESIFVSPVFKQYYEFTIAQREQLQAQIKAGLTSIANSFSDLELVSHDLRKYKEFMDYYQMIEKGKKLISEKNDEEGRKLVMQGNQTLRSIFIDQVDAHTDLPNTPIALRTIVSRWPTIIVDFMNLSDEDVEVKNISEKLNVSEAEGVVLATKNKLFLEWRKLFLSTVKERYQNLKRLVEARRKSVEEYKEMLKPTIARYKMMNESLSSPKGRAEFYRNFFRPDAQAFSCDYMRIWAWKPFAPAEKYKITRESLDKIPATKAGFTTDEIKEIRKMKESKDEKFDGIVEALPAEPSIDHIVRKLCGKIEKEYKVKITGYDMYEARESLIKEFKEGLEGKQAVGGEAWVFSPYFIFLDIPMERTVLKFPDGSELEDLMLSPLRAATNTQNLILARILEVRAKEKSMENYISQLMGDFGMKESKPIEEIFKEEYPEIYGKPEEQPKKGKILGEDFRKFRENFGKFMSALGLDIALFRAWGPYEWTMTNRIAKYYQPPVGTMFNTVMDYFKNAFGVP